VTTPTGWVFTSCSQRGGAGSTFWQWAPAKIDAATALNLSQLPAAARGNFSGDALDVSGSPGVISANPSGAIILAWSDGKATFVIAAGGPLATRDLVVAFARSLTAATTTPVVTGGVVLTCGADLPVVTLPTGFVFGGCEQSDTGLPNGSALRVRWSFTTVGNSFQGDLTLRKVPVGANLAAAGSQVVDINGNSGTFFSVGDSFRNTTRIVWASGKYAYDLVADFHPDNPGVAPLDRNTAFAFARSVR